MSSNVDDLSHKQATITNTIAKFNEYAHSKVLSSLSPSEIVEIKNNRLVSTNFNLSDTIQTEMTCWRYPIIQKGLDELDARNPKDTIDLKAVGNVIGKAVQLPQKDSTGKIGGTLYTTFIDLTEMKLVLVYKLDNSKIQKLDILSELKLGKKRKIKLE